MKTTLFVLISALLLLAACTQKAYIHPASPIRDNSSAPDAGLANPASVFCEKQGGTLRIQDDPSGSIGICTLGDGTVCEEWSYYRGQCPATTNASPGPVACTMDAKACPDGTFVGRVGPHCEWAPCPGPAQN